MSKNMVSSLSLQVGENERQRRFVWYYKGHVQKPMIQYALKDDYELAGGFTQINSKVTEGICQIIPNNPEYSSCKVRVNDLLPGKTYVYRVGNVLKMDDSIYEFSTLDNLNGKQVFNIVGDVHIKVRNFDSAESDFPQEKARIWQNLLKRMCDKNKDIAFILSAGDNVSSNNVYKSTDSEKLLFYGEEEHKLLFAPEQMKSIPFASVIGNHDTPELPENLDAGVTSWHYDLPNDDGVSGHYLKNSIGNFWFRSADVLVIGITAPIDWSGSKVNCSPEINKKYIEAACNANKDAVWKILINHIPPYAFIGNESVMQKMQQCFGKMLENCDIDAVFTADSHAFSRSLHIKDMEVVKENNIVSEKNSEGYQSAYVINPGGTVYYNIPAGMNHSFNSICPGYEKFLSAWGVQGEETIVMDGFDGVAYNSPMFTNVAVYKIDGYCAMTVKIVRSDNLESVDTYTIYKTRK